MEYSASESTGETTKSFFYHLQDQDQDWDQDLHWGLRDDTRRDADKRAII